MGEFDQLYREIILDHYKNPRGHGVIEGGDVDADRDGAGEDGDGGRDAGEGGAPRRDRDRAHADSAEVRDARPDDPEGGAAQGEGHAASRGPRRPRSALIWRRS